MKKVLVPLAALALVAAAPLAASAAPTKTAKLVIRHQVHGCHAWALNGGAYTPRQTLKLASGGALFVTNNDVMPHELVKTQGPAVSYLRVQEAHMAPMMGLKGRFPPQMLAHIGATVKVVFPHAGVYRFVTKAGEDYMEGMGMETVGEDYRLKLTVVVL